MRANELIEKAQFVTDSNGNKKAVLLDYTFWEELVELLQDVEDSREVERIRYSGEKPAPSEQVKSELADGRTEVSRDAQSGDWVTEKLNEVYSEVDSGLDPVLYAMQWASLRKEDW